MPLVSSVDYLTKKIYLGPDSIGVSLDTMDVYREVRERRRLNENDRKWDVMIVGGGRIQKTPTTFTPSYVQLLDGCEIIPQDVTQTLTIIRETFGDDGRSGPETFSTAGFANVVTIVYDVPQVEIVELSGGGGGGLTVEELRKEVQNASLLDQ